MRKELIGVVASAKMQKSLRVNVARRFAHPKYGKIVSRTTVCHVHDEDEVAKEGDEVAIEECRPISKTKRWRLVRVVKEAPVV